jgi:hypothetical protein
VPAGLLGATMIVMTPAPVVARPSSTPATTRLHFTEVSARGYTVVRNSFVQTWLGGKWVGSSLGRLVQARQHRALLAYLLLLMSWSAVDKLDDPLEADVWARALSPDPPEALIPASAMTRIWNALEAHGLITRKRENRRVRIRPQREDAHHEYLRPRPDLSKARREKFFALPDEFWLQTWHLRLGMPGVAMLLILLAETQGRNEVHIPYDRVQAWYGVSPKTMQNGLDELRKADLLIVRENWVRSDWSKIGYTQQFWYSLADPFSTSYRKNLQAAAAKATRIRAAKAVPRKRPSKKKVPNGNAS